LDNFHKFMLMLSHGKSLHIHAFQFLAISSTNMVALQTSEVGAALVPFHVGP